MEHPSRSLPAGDTDIRAAAPARTNTPTLPGRNLLVAQLETTRTLTGQRDLSDHLGTLHRMQRTSQGPSTPGGAPVSGGDVRQCLPQMKAQRLRVGRDRALRP